MVIIHGRDVKHFVSSIGEGTWDQVEANEDGSFSLRVASLKIMESGVELGFNPQTRDTDVMGRMYSPPSHTRPYKLHNGMGVKFLTQLKISKDIFAYTRYRLGYMLVDVLGKTEGVGLIFPKQIMMLDPNNMNIEVPAVTGRRLAIQPYAEFARMYFVAFSEGIPVDALYPVPEKSVLSVEVPDDIDDVLNKGIPIIKDVVFDGEEHIPDNVEIEDDE